MEMLQDSSGGRGVCGIFVAENEGTSLSLAVCVTADMIGSFINSHAVMSQR